jgi:hypothetical protein
VDIKTQLLPSKNGEDPQKWQKKRVAPHYSVLAIFGDDVD